MKMVVVMVEELDGDEGESNAFTMKKAKIMKFTLREDTKTGGKALFCAFVTRTTTQKHVCKNKTNMEIEITKRIGFVYCDVLAESQDCLDTLVAALGALSGRLSLIGRLAPAGILGSNSGTDDGKHGSEVKNDLHDCRCSRYERVCMCHKTMST